MVQKKSEDKSFVIYKKEELYDQLFNSLEGPEELRIGDMSPEREEKLKKILDYLYEKPGADTPEDREYWAEILEKVEAEKRAKKRMGVDVIEFPGDSKKEGKLGGWIRGGECHWTKFS